MMRRLRGASAVEFALALPFVLGMLLSATDFALWAFTRQAVSRSVQDGSRQASTMSLPISATDATPITDTAKTATLDALGTWGITASPGDINANWSPDGGGTYYLTVTATVAYDSPFGLDSFFNQPVTRTFVVFTQEQTPPNPP